jgi:predicted  nucleic acid-binding Zn-ribbon protein
MLEVLQRLLVLQDRDRRILQLQEELLRIEPERQELRNRLAALEAQIEADRLAIKKLETQRKELELEVEAKKQLIEKYSLQQYQTRKNEEYRALAHEIEQCKEAIRQLEDRQLDLMEQAENTQRQVAALVQTAAETRRTVNQRLADLDQAEANLKRQLSQLETERTELAAQVDEPVRHRYHRLLKARGGNAVVPIDRGVCGGCHMHLSRHLVVACMAGQELVSCPNCGRLLYYTPGMDVNATD